MIFVVLFSILCNLFVWGRGGIFMVLICVGGVLHRPSFTCIKTNSGSAVEKKNVLFYK